MRAYILLIVLALAIAPAGQLKAQFTDVTSGPLGDTAANSGMAWGDYDNDGDPDIFLTRDQGQHNVLLRNDGNDIFSDQTPFVLQRGRSSEGAAWGDYDNDGDLDLYVTNGIGSAMNNYLFRNEGGGSFVIPGNTIPIADGGDGYGTTWIDFDNDGNLDLYFVNHNSSNKLLRNEGDGSFVDVTSGPLVDEDGNGRGSCWGDYDYDGDLDLYLVNASDPNKLLRNDGGGVFSDVTSGPLGNWSHSGFGAGWGDYDNDGDLDIYLGNAGRENRLFRNDGNGVFADVTSGPLWDISGSKIAWGDYDNDGDLDLYVAGSLEGNKLLRNDGDGVFTDATSGPLGDTGRGQAVAWADYDGDGDLDLCLVNFIDPSKLFRNDQNNGNHWIHFDLVGTLSNRSGIGARVRIVTGGDSQIREISTDSGNLSQNSLTVEFGLGVATLVDSVIIRWPSGIMQDTTNVAVDQRITITEFNPMTGVGEDDRLPTVFALECYPNPFNPTTTIRYDLPETHLVTLRIYDVSGRLVRILRDAVYEDAGRHEAQWDGRDETGRQAASGTYFFRLEAGGYGETKRAVLVK